MSHILNPKTGRMIKIGGKPWRALVKEGLLPNDPMNPATATPKEIYAGKDEKDAIAVQDELKTSAVATKPKGKPRRSLRPKTHTQRRGNKIIEVKNQPKQEEIADFIARSASRTVHKNLPELTKKLEEAYDEDDDEFSEEMLKDFEENLRVLIHQEVISGGVNDPPNKYMRKKGLTKGKYSRHESEYEIVDSSSDDDMSIDDE